MYMHEIKQHTIHGVSHGTGRCDLGFGKPVVHMYLNLPHLLILSLQLGGVILPHDGLCKMQRPSTPRTEVDYNEWNVYDYPSIGQIAQMLRQNDIIPIFAAEANAKPIYDVSF